MVLQELEHANAVPNATINIFVRSVKSLITTPPNIIPIIPFVPGAQVNPHTPINPTKLQELLINVIDSNALQSLISGFSNGFVIFYQGPSRYRISQNHASATKNSTVMDTKIEKELRLGRIRGPFLHPPFPNFQSSPLGLVPKKEPNQYRVIHNLSFPHSDAVNSYIPQEFVHVKI